MKGLASASDTYGRRDVHTAVGGSRTLDRFVVFAVMLSLASAVIGAQVLLRSDLFRGSALDTPQVVDTSFGSLTVNGADILDGLTAQDLGGVVHGISGLVLSDKAQAQVSVTLRNTSDAVLPYSPELFRLREGATGQPIAPMGLAGEGVVPAGSSVDLLLDFVVTRSGDELFFEFQDLGSGKPVVVGIGPTDLAAPDDTGGDRAH